MALVIGVLLTGCTSAPLVNKLMNPDVSVNDHAVLYISEDISDVMIDGEMVKTLLSGYWGQEGFKTTPIIVLAPGEHTIQAKYLRFTERGGGAVDKSRSSLITITHNFNAGRRYYMYGAVEGNMVGFKIIDETDPAAAWRQGSSGLTNAEKRIAAQNKKISTTKYPSRVSPAVSYSILLDNALEADPTKFEGTWQYEYTKYGQQYVDEYIFIRNAFISNYMLNLGTGAALDGYIGTFDFTDNAITLTQLKTRKLLRSGGWANMKQKSVAYEYTITPEGLILTSKNKPLGTFVKQQTDEENTPE
jgi:hypothetical protein